MTKIKCILTQDNISIPWKDKDALSIYSRKMGYIYLPDRFGYGNKFSSWNLTEYNHTFPKKTYTSSLLETMFHRANEIISLAKQNNKSLYVLWSGGVDSTSVVLTLLESLSSQDKHLLKIIHTNTSITEYPKLYNFFKELKIELINVTVETLGKYCFNVQQTDYLIGGFPADQLFGYDVKNSINLSYNSDWREFIKNDTAIQQFEEIFSHYNMPIIKFNEFVWFINFIGRWNVITHFLPYVYGLPETSNMINFFATNNFQDWSISNFDVLHIHPQKEAKFYKKELKEIIYSIFPDEEYLNTKAKTRSIQYAHQQENNKATKKIPFISYIDENEYSKIIHYPYEVKSFNNEYSKIQTSMLIRFLTKCRKK